MRAHGVRKQTMRQAVVAGARVSRLCIGGNPFSGFSHQSTERDRAMRAYYTNDRIWETLDQAQAAGINTLFARVDEHILGVLEGYLRRNSGMQWFGQVCADVAGQGDANDSWKRWMRRAADIGATGLYIQGGLAEFWHAGGQTEKFHEAMGVMRGYGKVCGFAGHRPDVHEWIRDHLQPDFQMCSHYNPTDRRAAPQHSNVGEKWDAADRAAMLKVVATLPRPVVHYKVFAAGNRPIEEGFQTLGRAMRENDVACIGVFTHDEPQMIAKDVGLFERYVEGAGAK